MTDHELLLAISDIMDKKLDTRLIPIEENIHEMQKDIRHVKTDIVSMKADIDVMKTDIVSMKTDIDDMKTDIVSMKVDIDDMKADIVSMKSDIDNMKADIVSMKSDIDNMKADIISMKADIFTLQCDVRDLKLTQENIILPRLNTIESCYTTTYCRYKDYVDKMASAFVDIDLLKKVVSEHSERLQKIS